METIDFDELFSFKTIEKVIHEKHVLLSDQYTISSILDFYYQFNLIKTGHDKDFHLNGFPVRKYVSSAFKYKLREL